MTATLPAPAAPATDRDPFGRPCSSSGTRPRRHGRLVAYYRGRRAEGSWVLWDDDELRRPRWERACDVREHHQ